MIAVLKELIYRSWLHCRTFATERRRWRGAEDRSRPRVYYGHEYIPGPEEAASGGIIKCHDLAQVFPNTLRGGNILYLVSSALPALPERVVAYAKKNGAKFVLNQNGVAYPAYHGAGCERINAPRRAILGAADVVVYQSEFCKRSADIFLGPCSSPWKILYNPVDTSFFRPDERQEPGQAPRLLLAGSHHFRYRVVSALEAVAVLKQRQMSARLLLAGRLKWLADENACMEDIRSMCQSLRITDDVEYVGPYRQSAASDLMRSADILLHTQYQDSCPRLVVEAMACGLPVVYSASGGVPELVGEEAGAGIPAPEDFDRVHPPDPELLANGVERILADYRHFSRAARERALERFDVRPWVQAQGKMFEELLQ